MKRVITKHTMTMMRTEIDSRFIAMPPFSYVHRLDPGIIDQPPTCLLQKLVDLDPSGCLSLHALLVSSLQLLRAYSAYYLEVYHEHPKRPPQVMDVLARGFPPARERQTEERVAVLHHIGIIVNA